MKKIVSLICLIALMIINVAPAFSLDENSLKITGNKRKLHSRLSKRFTGYEFKIKNQSGEELKIENLFISDKLSAKTAYKSVSRTSIGAVSGTLAVGLGFALPTLTLSLIGAVIATPFIIIGNSIGNIGAKQESKRIDKSEAPSVIKPNQTLELSIITEKRVKPELKLTVQDASGKTFQFEN